ncbi:MAG: immune inhibitor A domain-containing protein [Ilumatobacteraceae bacterium]
MRSSNRARHRWWALAAVALPGLVVVAPGHSGAVPPSGGPGATPDRASGHELPNPLAERRDALRTAAIQQVIDGTAVVHQNGPSSVVDMSGDAAPGLTPTARGGGGGKDPNTYVELAREATDRVFVILAEFGNERHPDYPDVDSDPDVPGPVTFDGPLHNSIPEPDRDVDNSTGWEPDFSQEYFQNLYFGTEGETVKTYYEKQSSGRYSIDGEVPDWVKVRYNEARYGRSLDDSTAWFLVQDAANQWVADREAAGWTADEIEAELATYDVWDRYDHDGDGDFNEPDGYIDHFNIIHAGGDEADGDPYQGEDAIWSHRWYAWITDDGLTGPADNMAGGTEIADTGIWIGDYTVQAENGGISTIAHEYAHDLGIPDLYDTQGGSNAVEWWSIMAQSRVSGFGDQGIATRAADLDPWSKLQLGWLDYEVVRPDEKRTIELGPHEYNTAKPQAAIVVLPPKDVTREIGEPYAGEKQWWSGADDDLDNTMERNVTLPAGVVTLDFQAKWNIESGYDYAVVEVDDGSGWTSIPGSITNFESDNGLVGIEGVSDGWVPATFDLSAYAGQEVGLRFRYFTDGGVQGDDPDQTAGLFVDEIVLHAGDEVVFEDGAEGTTADWTLNGFTAIGATTTGAYKHYYIASYRQYLSFDRYLQSGPYNFGFNPALPDWVEHFPYQDGLLVWYWDTSYSDNNTIVHPGGGEILPIDANPEAIRRDGVPWRGRIQVYDAPFSLQRSDSFTLHNNGTPYQIKGERPVDTFDDTLSYSDPALPLLGVDLPANGTTITILGQKGTSMKIRVVN